MAAMLSAMAGAGFAGHPSIFQFINADGTDPATVCGTAAIATVLANRNRIPKTLAGLQAIEKAYPADILSGALGTSPSRIKSALRAYNLGYREVTGRAGLESVLRTGGAAISLIQNAPGMSGIGQGAHWFVVFGCDGNGVYVTNYNFPPFIPWGDFEVMWTGPIPTAAGMRERVIGC
ncbi:MAG: hypothetical protein WBD07_01095 [Vicinamibacterales bacterium]|mgnify:CR=1 FL=1